MWFEMFGWSSLTFLLSSLVLLPPYVNPDRGEDIDVAIRRCCYSGSEAGLSANPLQLTGVGSGVGSVCTQQAISSFLSKKPVRSGQEPACVGAAQLCCLREMRIQQCLLGTQAAKNGSQCDSPSFGQIQKDCCVACNLGAVSASLGSSCLTDALFPALNSLWKTAFTSCCDHSVDADVTTRTTARPDANSNLCLTLGSSLCAHRCIPTRGSFYCECEPGYTLMEDGKSCDLVDRCSNKDNPCEHYCTDTGLAVECSCKKGFRLAPDRTSCLDVDECDTLSHLCDNAFYNCRNRRGGYSCIDKISGAELRMGPDAGDQIGPSSSESPTNTTRCPLGFSFNAESRTCDDIDECSLGEELCEGTLNCKNTIGSFLCVNETVETCPPGFERTAGSTVCSDIDECLRGTDACDRSVHFCLNIQGGFECVPRGASTGAAGRETSGGGARRGGCPAGFKADPLQRGNCIDIDECLENTNLCNTRTEVCVNVVGAYKCSPKASSPSTERTTSSTISPSTPSSTLTSENPQRSSPGTSINGDTQKCPRGFQHSASARRCVDIDECSTSSPCDSTQSCRNTLGSYVCDCKQGFKKDPITHACIDINECQIGSANCLDYQRCDNTIGSYTCVRLSSCGTGYTLNAETGKCEDDDECELGTHLCGTQRVCRNTLGSFRCEAPPLPDCAPGFVANETTRRCVDVDECENSPCRPGYNCMNTVGSFQCELALVCGTGYQQNENGNQCVDIDECSTGSHKCLPGQRCINRPGGYQCLCPKGHKMTDGVCKDVDECETFKGQVCPPMATCHNVVGSYHCVCHDGYKSLDFENGHGCTDIDECSETPGICHHRCMNIPGSYRCGCDSGYVLAADNRTCEDINECEIFKDNRRVCLGHCVNQPGSFSCRCPHGYKLSSDGRTCQDINECAPSEINPCKGIDEDCFNIRGSFRCNSLRCPPGYKRDDTHKNRCNLQPCREYDNTCKTLPWSITSAFVSFTSNYLVPPSGRIDFFTLRLPNYASTRPRFSLKLESVQAGDDLVKATQRDFSLRQESPTRKVISLLTPLKGPQDIELHLSVDYYSERNLFISTALHKIIVVVSANEF